MGFLRGSAVSATASGARSLAGGRRWVRKFPCQAGEEAQQGPAAHHPFPAFRGYEQLMKERYIDELILDACRDVGDA